MHVSEWALTLSISEEDLQSLVAHLSLFSSDGLRPLYSRDDSVEGQGVYKRLMYGGLVSAPHVLRGLGTSRPGVYFLFPDVSIRHTGSYRIKVSLLRLPRSVLLHSCMTNNADDRVVCTKRLSWYRGASLRMDV